MNVALVLASLMVGTNYNIEDFHQWTNGSPRGLPLVNKVFVHYSADDKKDFVQFTNNLDELLSFKEFNNFHVHGFLLSFNNKSSTLKGLNECAKHYQACPVVMWEGIECIAPNELIVTLNQSANIKDYISRLKHVSSAKLTIKDRGDKNYLIKVDNLRSPSNILILANLVAQDKFWVESARIAYIPLDGYVKATASVETEALASLGEVRKLKINIDVFDPEIKVKIDLLPQFGQTFNPFPYAGEVWFDGEPPFITRVKNGNKETITASFTFKYLQYGSFSVQPITISYEKDGKLLTTKTNTCQFFTRSVIMGTEIDDIQGRGNDGLKLYGSNVVELPVEKNASLYKNLRLVGVICVSFGVVLLTVFMAGVLRSFTWNSHTDMDLWKNLASCRHLKFEDWRKDYNYVSQALNALLLKEFGTSLYNVDVDRCNDNFKYLMEELNNLYVANPQPNFTNLTESISVLCHQRNYLKPEEWLK